MNSTLVQQQLQLPYSRATWRPVLRDLLPGLELFAQDAVSPFTNEREREIATARRQFGRATLTDGKIVALYEIDVIPAGVDLIRNRVALRQLITRCIDQATAHAVLAFFLQSGVSVYRLTYTARESTIDLETLAVLTHETAARRYTYILGPGETRRTAASRLATLGEKHATATLADVTAAFSVERLNDEFFERYKEHYTAFCQHLLANDVLTAAFHLDLLDKTGKELDRARKPVRDFVKKLLGRLVFLHFLQKKGWLGCPALPPSQAAMPQEAVPWMEGQGDFIRRLFDSTPPSEEDHFYSARLVPLFFDTLNDSDRAGHLFSVTGTRVPYLNGGLFERDFIGVDTLDFPAALFRDLLDFFEQYHFTIDENDPEEQEIGIDPEMLGHIFENLLEDNKDKGAYYTPKAVVQYMTQQSLIHALAGRFPHDSAARGEIEKLIRFKEPVDPRDSQSWLAAHATKVAAHLDELKICDPAIGSGAFPIGLLQEIYWTQLTLNPALDRASAKRLIIQHSIHGVDLDAGAVEIARLRFWLALIVDEHVPRPLPNLDYQIMQGNSLLESFEGEMLDNLATPDPQGARQRLGSDSLELDLGGIGTDSGELTITLQSPSRHALPDLQSRYFACHEPEAKARLRAEIDVAVLGAIDDRLTIRRLELADALHRWDSREADNARRVRAYRSSAAEVRKRALWQAEHDALPGKLERLHALLANPGAERPFFLWHLWFRRILAATPEGRGGFDIVIANPPYGADIPATDIATIRSQYETLANSLDSFIVFMERGTRLLRPSGALAFIIPCGWVSTPSSRRLRSLFARSFHPHSFASLPYDVFGEAYVDTMIVAASRLPATESWESIPDKVVDLVVFPVRYRITELADFDRFHKASNFGLWGDPSEDGFLVTSSFDEAELVAKLRAMPFDFDHFVEVMRGIETYNPQTTPPAEHPRRALVGDIYRYEVNHTGNGYIAYSPGIEKGKPWRFFSGPRLLLRQLMSRKFRLQAAYTEEDFLTNQSVQSLVARNEATASIKVMLAVLNSKLISWYFCQINMVSRRDDFPKTIIKVTRELPVPDITQLEARGAQAIDFIGDNLSD